MKERKDKSYLAPILEEQVIVVERGYVGSMLEDPTVEPEQDW